MGKVVCEESKLEWLSKLEDVGRPTTMILEDHDSSG